MKKGGSTDSVKYLFLSDTHFGVHFAQKPRNKLKFLYGSRFFDIANEVICNSIMNDKIDFILHGGDFFNRSKPSSNIIQGATSSLLKAAKHVPVYIVPGNHERSKLPVGLLKFQKNINIFSEPCSFLFKKGNINIKIAGFPYIRHNAKLKILEVLRRAWTNEIDGDSSQSDYNILLMHQLIQGSKVEHYTFYRGHNVINYSDLNSNFHLIATGHVHRFQFLFHSGLLIKSTHNSSEIIQDVKNDTWTFGKGRNFIHQGPVICYPGSLEKVSMMERNEKKGFIQGIISKTTSASESIVESSIKFYQNTSIPMAYLKWDLYQKPEKFWLNESISHIKKMASSPITEELAGVMRISLLQPNLVNSTILNELKDFAKQQRIFLSISQSRAFNG
ncbi:MAG: metallophosphoesterase family protein [Candidatus Hodarchaeales archaeon]|jgi:DNA repair exonuclease SbcCD nuclease subunit